MKRLLPLLLAMALPFLCTGCAGFLFSDYTFGTTLPEDCRDVYIPMIRNATDQPAAATRLRAALEKEIRREGTLRIVNDEASATTRLDVTLTGYTQEAVAYNRTETQRPSEYRMVLTARVAFVKLPRAQAGETAEKPIYVRNAVSGTETFLGGADAVAAKLACLPKAAKNLAETIVDGCVGAWGED